MFAPYTKSSFAVGAKEVQFSTVLNHVDGTCRRSKNYFTGWGEYVNALLDSFDGCE